MGKQNNIPELRFPEFESFWQKKKLKELCTLITKGTTPNRFVESGVRFIKIECLLDDKIIDERCLFVDDLTHKKELRRSILNEGDILFAIAGATIGKCSIVTKEILPANTNQALSLIRLEENENKLFVYYCLKSNKMQKYIIDTISVGAQPNLNLEQMGNFSFSIPSLSEQTKIATFLTSIDDRLNQLKKKKTLLEQYKKGVMQKIFAQEIRFQDGDGEEFPEWEIKTINEIFYIKAGGDVDKSNVSSVKTEKYKFPIYSNSDKEKGLFGFTDTYRINEECITVTGRGTLGIAIARYQAFYPIVRLLVLTPKLPINVKFYENAINRINFAVESTGVPQLTSPQISNYSVEYPCLKEQTKIANFLSAIDDKISQCSVQINKTEQWKKGLLQQMFV